MSVECLEMRQLEDGVDTSDLPQAISLLEGPLLQRQVLLHLPEPLNRAFVYAASWWNADTVEEYLKYVECFFYSSFLQKWIFSYHCGNYLLSFCRDKNQPMWVSLSKERTEMYREILEVEYGDSPVLEE